MKKPLLTVEEQIRAIIEATKPSFNLLPGVVIIHNIQTRRVEFMSKPGEQALGVTSEELQKWDWEEYHSRFFNMEEAREYVPKIIALIEGNNNEEVISFFQQVKFSGEEYWRWHLSSTKIFLRDNEGKPLLIITQSIAIDPSHHLTAKVQRLLDENNLLRDKQKIFLTLTKREKEILKRMALGNNSIEIAEALFISEKTVDTHRRNIRAKLNAQSSYDIVRFAQAFNLI